MSLSFAQRGGNRPPLNPAQIQKMLDENGQLIQTIQDYQNKGKPQDCLQYQQILYRNLVYLASIADASQNVHNLLPVSRSIRLLYCLSILSSNIASNWIGAFDGTTSKS